MVDLFKDHRPLFPFQTGPVSLTITWCYPWRKSEPKKNRVNGWKYCDTKPDADNLSKMAQDVMTSLNFWTDDSQVAALHFVKIWGDNPRIEIKIKDLK